jgi:hypothetical protein
VSCGAGSICASRPACGVPQRDQQDVPGLEADRLRWFLVAGQFLRPPGDRLFDVFA